MLLPSNLLLLFRSPIVPVLVLHCDYVQVNTASRMESNGVKGKIHVSQSTADMLPAIWLTEREDKIIAKGKGEMTTWVVWCFGVLFLFIVVAARGFFAILYFCMWILCHDHTIWNLPSRNFPCCCCCCCCRYSQPLLLGSFLYLGCHAFEKSDTGSIQAVHAPHPLLVASQRMRTRTTRTPIISTLTACWGPHLLSNNNSHTRWLRLATSFQNSRIIVLRCEPAVEIWEDSDHRMARELVLCQQRRWIFIFYIWCILVVFEQTRIMTSETVPTTTKKNLSS